MDEPEKDDWATAIPGVALNRRLVEIIASSCDYCTKSPDFYYYPGGTSADFRGACARHDICYFDVKESGGAPSGFANCNRQLRDNLQTVCRNVYSNEFWIRSDCFFIANSYYEVVVTVHPTHWPGHLGG